MAIRRPPTTFSDTISTADIADDAISGDKLANDIAISTTGNIATTGSGVITSPIIQTDSIKDDSGTRVLASDSGSAWSWGSGIPANSIIQVQYVQKTDTFSTQSGSLTAIPGLNVNITPSSSSNKILITCHVVLCSTFYITHCGLFRDSTEIGLADNSENRTRSLLNSAIDDGNESDGEVEHLSQSFLDSPNTTSQVNYGLRMARRYDNSTSPTSYINRSSTDRSLPDGNETYDSRYISTITVMEIAQ